MERRPLNGDDVRLLNEQIQSNDIDVADLAKQILFESVQDAHRFADSTAQEWARRIVRRELRQSSGLHESCGLHLAPH